MSQEHVSLKPHPRLYLDPATLVSADSAALSPFVRTVAETVATKARACLDGVEFDYDHSTHNAHLIRARIMQGRIFALLTQYRRTGERAYRDAVIAHVQAMAGWEYWSWIAWRRGDARPDAIFDLSYGENSATLAVAYDLLHAELAAAERALFLDMARERALKPFLAHTGNPEKRAWWFGWPDSNWNTVCAGGAGMLALACHEELDEAPQVLELADASVAPFMAHLDQTGGGWEEGVGYWNYGMRYAFMYLLSHERATGRAHPLMALEGTRRTMRFPLDFAPNAVPAGFGDANGWTPLPFHVATAARLGLDGVVAALLGLMQEAGAERLNNSAWPGAAECLFLCAGALQDPAATPTAEEHGVVRLYEGMDWACLADSMPRPTLCCTVRGGTTEVPHGHRDLMSFNLVVRDEALIVNPSAGGYLDTTFSSRRNEIYEITPAAKNVVLVNGVGVTTNSRVMTGSVRFADGLEGIRIDGSAAMGGMRDAPAVDFLGRLYVLFGHRALLVLDRVETAFTALVETRLHTWGALRHEPGRAWIEGKRQRLALAWADTPATKVLAGADPLTYPVAPSTMLRRITEGLHRDVCCATLFVPGAVAGDGDGDVAVAIERTNDTLTVRATIGAWARAVRVSTRLEPA